MVVLVARTDARGLRATQAALRELHERVLDVELAGLVLMADAPRRLPRALRDLRRVVCGGVPRVWCVPWVEGAGGPARFPRGRIHRGRPSGCWRISGQRAGWEGAVDVGDWSCACVVVGARPYRVSRAVCRACCAGAARECGAGRGAGGDH